MQIVMVGPFGMRPRGTMSRRALPMAQALVARGYQVTILLPPWQNPEDSGQCWKEDGVAIENIQLPPSIPGFGHWMITLRLVRRLRGLNPDIVHCFKPKAYAGLVHWLLARLPGRRPRLVVDTDDWEGPGGWNDLAPYSPAQRRFFAWQERWGLGHADAVTVASRTLEGLAWALGVAPQRVVYVPNGVPRGLQVSDPELQPAISNSQSVILLYTRFFEFPVSRVIELLQRVREMIPQARLLVTGEGLYGEERQLLQLAQAAGLADVVEYSGWDPEALAGHMARAALAIYPFDDTLLNRTKCPFKLIELLAAGVPVVAESVGQIQEMIRHGETGWLVPPGDMEAFAGRVIQLLEDAPLREQMGQAAAYDVRERLGWDRLVGLVETAYGVGRE